MFKAEIIFDKNKLMSGKKTKNDYHVSIFSNWKIEIKIPDVQIKTSSIVTIIIFLLVLILIFKFSRFY